MRFDVSGSAVSAIELPFSSQTALAISVDDPGWLLVVGNETDPIAFSPTGLSLRELSPQGDLVWSWPPTGGSPAVFTGPAFATGFDRRGYPLLAGLVPAAELFIAFAGEP